MTLGDKPNLNLSEKKNFKNAKDYFIELFDKGYNDMSTYDLVSRWYGKEAADYAYEKVLGN